MSWMRLAAKMKTSCPHLHLSAPVAIGHTGLIQRIVRVVASTRMAVRVAVVVSSMLTIAMNATSKYGTTEKERARTL